MSSRVHPTGEAPTAEPLVWRTAATAPPGGPGSLADNSAALRAQAAQLQQQFENQVRDAHAAGMREGEAAGRARATAEVQPVIESLARSMDDLAGMRARLRAEAEADLVQLSLAIARRILHRDIAIDPDALH